MVSDNSVGPIQLLPQLERRHVTSAASENVTATQQRWLPMVTLQQGTSAELSRVTLTGGERSRLTSVLVLFIFFRAFVTQRCTNTWPC